MTRALAKAARPTLARGSAAAWRFIVAGFLGAATARLLLEGWEVLFSWGGGALLALGGGGLTWVAFRHWQRKRPLLCALAMGFYSGIAGGGTFVLAARLLTAVTPAGGLGRRCGEKFTALFAPWSEFLSHAKAARAAKTTPSGPSHSINARTWASADAASPGRL
jgi:hypothetical protein